MSSLLLIEDNDDIQKVIIDIAKRLNLELAISHSYHDGFETLFSGSFDLVAIESCLRHTPSFSPMQINGDNSNFGWKSYLPIVIPALLKMRPIPQFFIIAIVGFPDEAKYVIDIGALDYINISGDFDAHGNVALNPTKSEQRIINSITHGMSIQNGSYFEGFNLDGIIGECWKFKRSLVDLVHASKTDLNILIMGERGTGKKLFAKKIHINSNRKDYPYVVIDCRDENIVDDFFNRCKRGENDADLQGTVLLHDIEYLPTSLQSQLLKSINELNSKFGLEGKGTSKPRFIATTAVSSEEILYQNNIIHDLYYELSVFSISLPPLVERNEDIIPIAIHHNSLFLANHPSINLISWTDDFKNALTKHNWPGNISELISVLKNSIINLGKDNVLDVCHLPSKFKSDTSSSTFYTSVELNRNSLKNVFDLMNSVGIEVSGPLDNKIIESKSSENSKPTMTPMRTDENYYYFYEKGDYWIAGKAEEETYLKIINGYRYIHFLLQFPNADFKPIVVYHLGKISAEMGDKYQFDGSEEVSYNEPLKLSKNDREIVISEKETLEEIIASGDISDPEEESEIREKIKKLDKVLKTDSSQKTNSEEEKARINVTKAIRTAFEALELKCPSILQYLNKSTINTGYNMSYRPLPGDRPEWILHSDPSR